MGKVIVKHRYGWSVEEVAVIVVLGVAGLGLSVWAVADLSLGVAIGAGFCLFLAIYSHVIANGRKRKSTVTAVFDDVSSELMVSGHTFEGLKNVVVLDEVHDMSVKAKNDGELTVRDLLVVHSGEGDKSRVLKFPLRLLSVPEFWAFFEGYAGLSDSDKVREAIEFGRSNGRKV